MIKIKLAKFETFSAKDNKAKRLAIKYLRVLGMYGVWGKFLISLFTILTSRAKD